MTLTQPASTAGALRQTRPRKCKVLCVLRIALYMYDKHSSSSYGVVLFLYRPGGRLIWNFVLDILQGVLYRSGLSQDSGKENVDPAPRERKVSMSPNSAQIITVLGSSLIAPLRTHKCAQLSRCVVEALTILLCRRLCRNNCRMWRRMSTWSLVHRFLLLMQRELGNDHGSQGSGVRPLMGDRLRGRRLGDRRRRWGPWRNCAHRT